MTESDMNLMESLPPTCGPTVERLQLVLDGELPAAALDADPHPAACPSCRGRIAAVRLVLTTLASPHETSVPTGLADSILSAVREDRYARIRRRSYIVAGGVAVAIAASVLLLTWLASPPPAPIVPHGLKHPEVVHVPLIAPDPRPVRLGAEFSKVGQALLDSSKPITEPAASAPGVFAMLGGSLTSPVGPVAEFEPARTALAELPDAARAGLEPVTSTTQKAFARLLRDVGGVQVSTKPKS